MLKMALLDCAINEKCCSADGGQGICPLFSSPPPRGFDSSRVSTPREFAIQGNKKSANTRGSATGGSCVIQRFFKQIREQTCHNVYVVWHKSETSKTNITNMTNICWENREHVERLTNKQLRACLHGVGDPGLVGLVSFVFTLWRTQNKRNLPH